MDSITGWAEKCFRRRSRPSSMIKGAYEHTSLLNIDGPYEEETLPGYKAKNYYPVQIGQPLNARYKVLGKLKYDTSGTAWFCQDKKTKRYVEVKVCVAFPSNGSRKCRSTSEWNAYSHLSGMVTDNPGFSFLRQILDRFTVVSPIGSEHQCFVYNPTGLDLAEFQRLAPNADMKLIKDILRAMLQALDFLHRDARIMHTDFKPESILFTVTHRGTLEAFAKKLQSKQPTGKRDAETNRIIYQTVRFTTVLQLHELSLGKPVLADLGGARIVHKNDDQLLPRDMTPDSSRSPEICMGMCWTFNTDIWSYAVVTWQLLSRTPLFSAYDGVKGGWNIDTHLGQMASLLGPPPEEFGRAKQIWDRKMASAGGDGETEHVEGLSGLNVDATFVDWDLDQRTEFLEFMHAMLKWKAEERMPADELLYLAFMDDDRSYE